MDSFRIRFSLTNIAPFPLTQKVNFSFPVISWSAACYDPLWVLTDFYRLIDTEVLLGNENQLFNNKVASFLMGIIICVFICT